MNYVNLAIVAILLVTATVLFFLWREARSVAKTMTEIATDAAEEKERVKATLEFDKHVATAARDWYRDENLRLQGANQRLADMVFRKKTYEKLLIDSMYDICVKCQKDKIVNESTGIPDACVGCENGKRKRMLIALKGAHEDGTAK